MTDTVADHFINAIANARLALDEAQAAYGAAVAEVSRLKQRIAECESRRAAITERRLAGTSTPDEANEFVALASDMDALNELLAEAQAHADELFPGEQRNALARAEAELQQYQQQVEFDALVEHARVVEQVYVDMIAKVWASAQQRGARTIGEAFPLHEVVRNIGRFNSFHGLGSRP